jgi:hypothetical protein
VLARHEVGQYVRIRELVEGEALAKDCGRFLRYVGLAHQSTPGNVARIVRRHIGQELLANRRPAPVRTNQQIAAFDPAVLELPDGGASGHRIVEITHLEH